jgi:hypothetical protein
MGVLFPVTRIICGVPIPTTSLSVTTSLGSPDRKYPIPTFLIAERAVEILDTVEVARLVAPAQADEPGRGDIRIVKIGVGDVGAEKLGAAERLVALNTVPFRR